jgi:hypothetical protein
MAISSKASGSTLMILNTDVTLATISTAGVYVINIDTNPIANGETLILIVEKKVLTGSTRRIIDRIVVAYNAGLAPVVEDKPRESLYELVYKLRQEGGTARTIDWNAIQLA